MVSLAGEETINTIVSHQLQHMDEWRWKRDAKAGEAAAYAHTLAQAHHHSGDLAASIRVDRERLDAYVTMNDPDAAHIEWGHDAPDGSWVHGLHIMRNAALAAGGVPDNPRGA